MKPRQFEDRKTPFERLPLSKEERKIHTLLLHIHRVFKRAVVLLYPGTRPEEDSEDVDYWAVFQPTRPTLIEEGSNRLAELMALWNAYIIAAAPTEEEIAARLTVIQAEEAAQAQQQQRRPDTARKLREL